MDAVSMETPQENEFIKQRVARGMHSDKTRRRSVLAYPLQGNRYSFCILRWTIFYINHISLCLVRYISLLCKEQNDDP